jgi:diacylglycerol kinase-like protein
VSATKPAEQHSETTATRRGVLMVNTQARSGADAYASAKKLLQQRGFVLDEFHAVPEPARISGLVGQAVAQGHDLIVGGSDGTISAAGNVLQGKDVTCGILPLGTANSFARGLDLPLDLTAAVDVLVHGRNERGRSRGVSTRPISPRPPQSASRPRSTAATRINSNICSAVSATRPLRAWCCPASNRSAACSRLLPVSAAISPLRWRSASPTRSTKAASKALRTPARPAAIWSYISSPARRNGGW